MQDGVRIDLLTGRTVPNTAISKAKATGDLTVDDVFGYQKVKYMDGTPVVTAKGEHVYKLTNLLGDGMLVSEQRVDARPSVLNNGTVNIIDEISDGDIIRILAPRIEEKAVPLEEKPAEPTATKITTTSGKLKLKDGKEYLISDINAALLEKIGYKPKEIGKLLKSIC